MSLKEKLTEDLHQAQKSRAEVRVSVLRFLLAYLHNLEIQKQRELNDEEVVQAIQKQAKDRQESIAAFKKGNRPDLVEKEEKELAILRSYLPAQLSAEELETIIDKVIKEGDFSSPADFGKVMGQVMGRLKGHASGEEVASLVKAALEESS